MKKKIAVLTTGWSVEYFDAVINGLQEAIKGENIDLYIFLCYGYYDETKDYNEGEYNIFNLIHYEDFDGIIMCSNVINSLEIIERERKRIIQSKTPAISLEYELEGLDYIGSDNYGGMYEVTEHMIKDHNLRDIAYVGGPENNDESLVRKKAFLDAMTNNNIPINEDRLFLDGDWSYNYAYAVIQQIIDSGSLPEGIVCVNDEGAIAAVTCLNQNDIMVPDKIKVVGFDNRKTCASFIPSITSVNRKWSVIGKCAFEHLKKMIDHIPVDSKEILYSKVEKRGSCGCANGYKKEQLNVCIKDFHKQKQTLEFSRHLRHFEDIFMEKYTPKEMMESTARFLEKDHSFEGKDFCFMIEKENIPISIDINAKARRRNMYSDQLLKAIHIQNDKIQANENFCTRDLVPKSMLSDNSSTFLFIPLHYESYVLGYFVCKDNLNIIENRFCYDWSKGISYGFEKYCQQYVYTLMNNELTDLYMRDAMTGLLNRIGYHKLAYNYYEQNRMQNKDTVFIFADINSMKQINDNFGHLHGDLSINTVAEVMKKTIPQQWLTIRYGGDEYLIIGTVESEKQADKYCELTSRVLREQVELMALPYKLCISMGNYIVTASEDITLEEAVKIADKRMYYIKTEYYKSIKDN